MNELMFASRHDCVYLNYCMVGVIEGLLCRWAGDEGGGRGVAGGDGSSSEEDEGKESRAEELRRERLSAVVKRNLTGILLEVTDSMFGESTTLCVSCHRIWQGRSR